MPPTTASSRASLAARGVGLVVGVSERRDGTDVEVERDGAATVVALPTRPDDDAARHRALNARRIGWVRIDVDPADPATSTCTLVSTPHRLPVRCRIGLAAALGLARLGVPTVIGTRS